MLLQRVQDIKVEGLEVMKLLMERRKEELQEEAEAAEAKQNADREVRPIVDKENTIRHGIAVALLGIGGCGERETSPPLFNMRNTMRRRHPVLRAGKRREGRGSKEGIFHASC